MAITVPWISKGWLLTLDWVHGPYGGPSFGFNTSVVPQDSILLGLALAAFDHVVGNATASWLLPAVVLWTAAVTAGRAAPTGAIGKAIAAALYSVNPFVYDRLYAGQIGTLAGYAILPLVATSLVSAVDRRGWRRWTAPAWIAIDGAIDIHFLWISLVILVAVVIDRRSKQALTLLLGSVCALVALEAYLLVPTYLQRTTLAVNGNDLTAFRTAADPALGLLPNVLGLYGFWRAGPILAKSYVPMWPLIALAVLGLSAYGSIVGVNGRRSSALVRTLPVAAVFGALLAMGDQGATGSLFVYLYQHLPGFTVMREPEKFSALIALFYSLCGAVGVEATLRAVSSQRLRMAVTVLALGGVAGYTPVIFNGLHGQVRTSHYPNDFAGANAAMGSGPGKILVLPLHEYMAFSFTKGRDIANPAPDVFSRPSLVGAEIEAGPLISDSLSPEDAYLERLVQTGPKITHLGHLVSQLGVRYVALLKTADYSRYGWLAQQHDLTLTYNGPDVAVYTNRSALPTGSRLGSSIAVPSLSCYLQLAQAQNLTGTAVAVDPSSRCDPPTAPPRPEGGVQRISAHEYRVGTGGGAASVIPEPADGTWVADKLKGLTLADGVQGFDVGSKSAIVHLKAVWAEPLGDGLSMLTLLLLIADPKSWRRRATKARSRLQTFRRNTVAGLITASSGHASIRSIQEASATARRLSSVLRARAVSDAGSALRHFGIWARAATVILRRNARAVVPTFLTGLAAGIYGGREGALYGTAFAYCLFTRHRRAPIRIGLSCFVLAAFASVVSASAATNTFATVATLCLGAGVVRMVWREAKIRRFRSERPKT